MEEIPDFKVGPKTLNTKKPNYTNAISWMKHGYLLTVVYVKKSVKSAIKKRGEGCRYIVVHAGIKHGFTGGASLIFTAKTKSGDDYYDNMDQEIFEK